MQWYKLLNIVVKSALLIKQKEMYLSVYWLCYSL